MVPGGMVSGNWTLQGSPYKVYGNIEVPLNSVLQIDPGINIVFYGHFGLIVHGRLIANGTENNSISFTVSDTTGFSDTTTTIGGWQGIRFLNSSFNDSCNLQYCDISFGKAVGVEEERKGGGVYLTGNSKLLIENCLMHNNLAANAGGGIFCDSGAIVKIRRSTIVNNRCFQSGGGIYIGINCNALVERNTIAFNRAQYFHIIGVGYFEGGAGGGLYFSNAFNDLSPIIINNFICNNFAVLGGGLYESCKNIIVFGNVICNNSYDGIASGHQLGKGKYYNNTICNNANMGGLQVVSTSLKLKNNIIWGNTNNQAPGEQIFSILTGQELSYVSFSNIQNGYPGEGNIDSNPNFTLPTTGAGINFNALVANWLPIDTSPCINMGDFDTTGMSLPEKDIAENPRIYGYRIDMGAFENQSIISNVTVDNFLNQIQVSPNPCQDYLIFKTAGFLGTIYICDQTGRFKKIIKINSNIQVCDVSGLSPGIYIAEFKTDIGSKAFKFLKLGLINRN